MNSAVKNGKVQLTKSNYFAHLNNKAKCYDFKGQEGFNKEILNCLKILDSKLVKQEELILGVKESYEKGFSALSEYVNQKVLPFIKETDHKATNALNMSLEMTDYVPEYKKVWEERLNTLENKTEGDETMNG